MIRLDDVLTDEEIRYEYTRTSEFYKAIRACIALAVEKWPEKVRGYARLYGHGDDDIYVAGSLLPTEHHEFRHALLLLGPRYEPKPVKSMEQRGNEALAKWDARGNCQASDIVEMAYEMARILRGEEGR